jgi:transcriptional regulator with XRE-family HTH domain
MPKLAFRVSLRSGAPKPSMASTVLASVDSREVLKCLAGGLVQFTPHDSTCRRCRQSLEDDEPGIAAPTRAIIFPINGHGHGDGGLNLANSIRSLRLRNGLSQRELALRMSVARTYVSKLETGNTTPTLSTLARLARGLGLTISDLLSHGERGRREETHELLQDHFVRSVLPFLPKLNQFQRAVVLSRAADFVAEASRARIVR